MRYYLFTIGQKYKFRAEWASVGRFLKWYYFLFYFNSNKNTHIKRHAFDLIIFGLYMTFSKPYLHKFSYKNMPKIKGRRKA